MSFFTKFKKLIKEFYNEQKHSAYCLVEDIKLLNEQYYVIYRLRTKANISRIPLDELFFDDQILSRFDIKSIRGIFFAYIIKFLEPELLIEGMEFSEEEQAFLLKLKSTKTNESILSNPSEFIRDKGQAKMLDKEDLQTANYWAGYNEVYTDCLIKARSELEVDTKETNEKI